MKVIRAEGLMAADVTGKKRCNYPVVCVYINIGDIDLDIDIYIDIKQHAGSVAFND